MEKLQTRRWNFSTSTTRISDFSEGDAASITSDDAIAPEQPVAHKEKDTLHLGIGSGSENRDAQRLWLAGNRKTSIPSISLDSPLPLESPSSIDSPGIAIAISSPSSAGSSVFSQAMLGAGDLGISASVNRVRTENRDKSSEDSRQHLLETDRLKILGMVSL